MQYCWLTINRIPFFEQWGEHLTRLAEGVHILRLSNVKGELTQIKRHRGAKLGGGQKGR